MQARGVKDTAIRRLEALGFTRAHAYQPQHLFAPNGRKLNKVAEPGDPWVVFATTGGKTFSATAATPREAASTIVIAATMPSFAALAAELDKLMEALRGERPRT